MARYIDRLMIDRLESGRRYYKSSIPRTPNETTLTTHEARRGDRWDTLAYKYYGRAALWYTIALANGGANGSMFIEPGTVVRIPER